MSDPLRIAFGTAWTDDAGELAQVHFLGTCRPDGTDPYYSTKDGKAAALRIGLVLVDGELLDVLAWQRVVLSGPPRRNGVRPSACMDASHAARRVAAKAQGLQAAVERLEKRAAGIPPEKIGTVVFAESLEARRAGPGHQGVPAVNLLPLLCDGYDPTTGERYLGLPRLLYPHEDGVLQWGVVESPDGGARVLERVVLWWPAGSVPGEGWLQRAERIRASFRVTPPATPRPGGPPRDPRPRPTPGPAGR